MSDKSRHIEIPVLARVEGEGALEIEIANGEIRQLQLKIYEPPRFFEKLLEGRSYKEIPDIVARICGICPVAYQMSAVQAIENIFQITPGKWVQDMRRLLYCGEWIESHALHIHLLAAPDFLGFDNFITMADRYPEEAKRGLELQGLGNRIIRMMGGRSVHPVSVCTGGFTHAMRKTEAYSLLNDLKYKLEDARKLIYWTAKFRFPDIEQNFVSVALRHTDKYPMYDGHIASSTGLYIHADEYQEYFTEAQVAHSTALHSTLNNQPYLVGPLARINLNFDRLPDPLKLIVEDIGIQFPSNNMHHSIVVRAIEIYYALQEAITILQHYQMPDSPSTSYEPKAGTGVGCTEAPRGILWHSYTLDQEANVLSANIIPPTSQNQARIEDDLRKSLHSHGFEHTDDELRRFGETIIRNYDPCISCATHFLKLKVKRT